MVMPRGTHPCLTTHPGTCPSILTQHPKNRAPFHPLPALHFFILFSSPSEDLPQSFLEAYFHDMMMMMIKQPSFMKHCTTLDSGLRPSCGSFHPIPNMVLFCMKAAPTPPCKPPHHCSHLQWKPRKVKLTSAHTGEPELESDCSPTRPPARAAPGQCGAGLRSLTSPCPWLWPQLPPRPVSRHLGFDSLETSGKWTPTFPSRIQPPAGCSSFPSAKNLSWFI